jgi:glucuronoxylan 4-O-methyltransferase
VISHHLSAISNEIKEEIAELAKNNPYQLSEAEYTLIVEMLISKSPCNMLVFGVGKDSKLWINLNLGKTVFLEDNLSWFERICAEIPHINAHLVEYNTQRKEWKSWLKKARREDLLLNLPLEVWETKWDIIFVDGPEGWTDEKPGRMKSIYTAAMLAQKSQNCEVFVHDCDRPVEAAYSSTFLLDENLVDSLDRLRRYHLD